MESVCSCPYLSYICRPVHPLSQKHRWFSGRMLACHSMNHADRGRPGFDSRPMQFFFSLWAICSTQDSRLSDQNPLQRHCSFSNLFPSAKGEDKGSNRMIWGLHSFRSSIIHSAVGIGRRMRRRRRRIMDAQYIILFRLFLIRNSDTIKGNIKIFMYAWHEYQIFILGYADITIKISKH